MEEKKRYWEGNICVGPDTASDITTTSGSTVQQVLDDHEERIEDLEAGFELIEEITLEEDTVNINRSQTPDSKDYNLTDVYVQITVPPLDAPNRIQSYLQIDAPIGYNITNLDKTAQLIRYYNHICILHKGIYVASGICVAGSQVNESSLFSTGYSPLIKTSNILGIRIGSYNNPYPTGTTIKIYGVWA